MIVRKRVCRAQSEVDGRDDKAWWGELLEGPRLRRGWGQMRAGVNGQMLELDGAGKGSQGTQMEGRWEKNDIAR